MLVADGGERGRARLAASAQRGGDAGDREEPAAGGG